MGFLLHRKKGQPIVVSFFIVRTLAIFTNSWNRGKFEEKWMRLVPDVDELRTSGNGRGFF
jgi:hypothetical protein